MSCPDCGSGKSIKYGYYKNNQQKAQKFLCKNCNRQFSGVSQELGPNTKQEHRPELNDPVCDLRLKGMSIREIARHLGCAKKTVERKLKKYLG